MQVDKLHVKRKIGLHGHYKGNNSGSGIRWLSTKGFLSTLMMNLVMNELLYLLDHKEHKILKYADDLVILIQDKLNNLVRG